MLGVHLMLISVSQTKYLFLYKYIQSASFYWEFFSFSLSLLFCLFYFDDGEGDITTSVIVDAFPGDKEIRRSPSA